MTNWTTTNSLLVNSLLAISTITNSYLANLTFRPTHYVTFSPMTKSLQIKVTIALTCQPQCKDAKKLVKHKNEHRRKHRSHPATLWSENQPVYNIFQKCKRIPPILIQYIFAYDQFTTMYKSQSLLFELSNNQEVKILANLPTLRKTNIYANTTAIQPRYCQKTGLLECLSELES